MVRAARAKRHASCHRAALETTWESCRGMDTLKKMLRPQSVAVIGASETPGKVGATVLSNLIAAGFEGKIYPINNRCQTVQGRAAAPTIGDCKGADLAVVCTPAETVPGLIRECGAAGVAGLIVLSAGFRETGAAGKLAEAAIADELKRFPNMRVIGPNCLGVIAPGVRLNASFAASMPSSGKLAFVSQSGALCTAVLDWAQEKSLGFSQFISIGNMVDVNFGDVLDFLADDPATDAVLLYIESVIHARSFMSAARACTFRKPVVAYKAGRFEESALAAASHTGAMVGLDSVYEAALERAGIVRIRDMNELFDSAEILARGVRVRKDRLAILTNAGGPGVMACDALLEKGCQLARLSEATLSRLDRELPRNWSRRNPVDILGDASPARFGVALRAIAADEGVDAVLTILTPQAMTDPTACAQEVIAFAAESELPILTCWMGGPTVHEGIQLLDRHGIPTARTPNEAIAGFANLVRYARARELLYETPQEVPLDYPPARSGLRAEMQKAFSQATTMLSESQAKRMLSAYGIPVAQPVAVATAEEAVHTAQQLGFPVVLKVVSPQVVHKTDVGGVELNLLNASEVQAAYDRITSNVRSKCPDAEIQAITVQPMVTQAGGIELILGMKKDPVFGPVIMVGLGGVTAELLRDSALGLPPLNERLALRMLKALKAWPLLTGYRGRGPIVDTEKLVECMLRFSQLIADFPELKEIDVNPLIVRGTDVMALDARMALDPQAIGRSNAGYAHLAIRPYPLERVQSAQLNDGTEITLRPIRPEDEPLWRAMLSRCSRESLWSRFRYMFKFDDHESATRFCFVDYDREFTMVAEQGADRDRQLIGVARIVEQRRDGCAELAVLVDDRWQGRGLGKLLTRACLESVDRTRIGSVYAETLPTNHRMIQVLKRTGFAIAPVEDNRLVRGTMVFQNEKQTPHDTVGE